MKRRDLERHLREHGNDRLTDGQASGTDASAYGGGKTSSFTRRRRKLTAVDIASSNLDSSPP